MSIIARTDVLSGVELSEILEISIVESRLKKNFQIILQQLRRKSEGDLKRDETILGLKQQMKTMNMVLQKQRFAENNQYVNIQEINDLREQILKQITNKNKVNEKEIEARIFSNKKDLIQQINQLKEQINSMGKQQKDKVENLEKSIMIKIQEIRGKNPPSSSESNNRNYKKNRKQDIIEDQLTQKINELKKELLTYIDSQNKETETILNTHTKQIWDINEKLFSMEKISDETKKQITEKQEEDRRNFGKWVETKDLLNKVEGFQYDLRLLRNEVDTLDKNLKDIQTDVHSLNFNKSKINLNSHIIQDQNDLNWNEAIKKQVLNKLSEQRKQYISLFKSLKDNTNNTINQGNLKQKLSQYEIALSELKLLLTKKADQETSKKAILFLQKKINYTFNTFSGNLEGDARIAKCNWLCLSCDRNLASYTGKIGQFIVNDAVKSKKLNFEYSTQKGVSLQSTANMRNKSKSKVELPFVSSFPKKFE